MTKIKVSTDTPAEFKLIDTAADIHRRRGEIEQREREETEKQQREESQSEEAGRVELHSHNWRRQWPKNNQELSRVKVKWTQGTHEEAGTSPFLTRHKKKHMRNIYLTDSGENAIVDIVNDHGALQQNHKQFKDKAIKYCLWKRFASSRNLSVKVCKTWFEFQRTGYGKITQSKSGQAPKKIKEKQNWIKLLTRIHSNPRYHQARPDNQLNRPKWCPEDSSNPGGHRLYT